TLQPKSGGTFRYGYNADPPHLDPVLTSSYAMHAAVTPVYNRMMRGKWANELDPFDPWAVQITTDLTQKYETPDGLTYTFKLTPGVKSQDIAPLSGRLLTSNDVKYSYTRYSTPESVWSESFKVIDNITTPDDSTVVIKLKEIASYFVTS